MALPNGATKRTGVHATGQPDTPVEVITALLQSALQSGSVDDMKKQLQQAYDVVAGLDPYLEAVSTPPSAVRTALISHNTGALGKVTLAVAPTCTHFPFRFARA